MAAADDLRVTLERDYEGQPIRVTYRDPQPLFLPGGTLVVGPDAEVELPDDVALDVRRVESASELFGADTIAELNEAGLEQPYRRGGPPGTWAVHSPLLFVLGLLVLADVAAVPIAGDVMAASLSVFLAVPLGSLLGFESFAVPGWVGRVLVMFMGMGAVVMSFVDPEAVE